MVPFVKVLLDVSLVLFPKGGGCPKSYLLAANHPTHSNLQDFSINQYIRPKNLSSLPFF